MKIFPKKLRKEGEYIIKENSYNKFEFIVHCMQYAALLVSVDINAFCDLDLCLQSFFTEWAVVIK